MASSNHPPAPTAEEQLRELAQTVASLQEDIRALKGPETNLFVDKCRRIGATVAYIIAVAMPSIAILNLAAVAPGPMHAWFGVDEKENQAILDVFSSYANGIGLWVYYAIPVVASLVFSAALFSAANKLMMSLLVIEHIERVHADARRENSFIRDVIRSVSPTELVESWRSKSADSTKS